MTKPRKSVLASCKRVEKRIIRAEMANSCELVLQYDDCDCIVLRWPSYSVTFRIVACVIRIDIANLQQFLDTTKFRHPNWVEFQQEFDEISSSLLPLGKVDASITLHSLTRNLEQFFFMKVADIHIYVTEKTHPISRI